MQKEKLQLAKGEGNRHSKHIPCVCLVLLSIHSSHSIRGNRIPSWGGVEVWFPDTSVTTAQCLHRASLPIPKCVNTDQLFLLTAFLHLFCFFFLCSWSVFLSLPPSLSPLLLSLYACVHTRWPHPFPQLHSEALRIKKPLLKKNLQCVLTASPVHHPSFTHTQGYL